MFSITGLLSLMSLLHSVSNYKSHNWRWPCFHYSLNILTYKKHAFNVLNSEMRVFDDCAARVPGGLVLFVSSTAAASRVRATTCTAPGSTTRRSPAARSYRRRAASCSTTTRDVRSTATRRSVRSRRCSAPTRRSATTPTSRRAAATTPSSRGFDDTNTCRATSTSASCYRWESVRAHRRCYGYAVHAKPRLL